MEKTKDPEENDVDIEEERKEPENIKNKEEDYLNDDYEQGWEQEN